MIFRLKFICLRFGCFFVIKVFNIFISWVLVRLLRVIDKVGDWFLLYGFLRWSFFWFGLFIFGGLFCGVLGVINIEFIL